MLLSILLTSKHITVHVNMYTCTYVICMLDMVGIVFLIKLRMCMHNTQHVSTGKLDRLLVKLPDVGLLNMYVRT